MANSLMAFPKLPAGYVPATKGEFRGRSRLPARPNGGPCIVARPGAVRSRLDGWLAPAPAGLLRASPTLGEYLARCVSHGRGSGGPGICPVLAASPVEPGLHQQQP